jgi:hypothetical protein
MMPALRRHAAAEPGRQRLATVQAACPQAWQELAALAAGAQVSLGDLAMVNFRGVSPRQRHHRDQ